MTTTTSHLTKLTDLAATAQLPVVARVASSFATTVTVWVQRARSRRVLSNLSAAQLKDVGLSLREARAEACKKMWQI